jgi:ATP-binding cassette subfamily F protein 3
MREALAEALQDFSGGMVIVSHDRYLLSVTCDKLMLVHEQTVSEFPLSLDEYPKWLSEQNTTRSNAHSTTAHNQENDRQNISSKDRKRIEAEQRQKTQPLRNKIKRFEDTLQKVSENIFAINQLLSDNDIYTEKNKDKLQQLLLDKAALEKTHEITELDWLEANEQLDNLS